MFSSHVKFCETDTTMTKYITPAVFVDVFWFIQLVRFRDVSFDDCLWQRKVNRIISYRELLLPSSLAAVAPSIIPYIGISRVSTLALLCHC